jgi:hypothetical protein
MALNVTYGPGGYDPAAAHDNVAEIVADNGDGTGTLTEYTDAGPLVTEVTGLPIETPEPVDPYKVYAAAVSIAETLDEVRAAGAQLAAALEAG